MKLFLTICAILIITAQAAYAHPPEAIRADYDRYENTLRISVEHPVRNQNQHCIKKIEIIKGGKVIAKEKFSSQANRKRQDAEFILKDIKDGDVVLVEAHCSLHGMLKKQVKFNEN